MFKAFTSAPEEKSNFGRNVIKILLFLLFVLSLFTSHDGETNREASHVEREKSLKPMCNENSLSMFSALEEKQARFPHCSLFESPSVSGLFDMLNKGTSQMYSRIAWLELWQKCRQRRFIHFFNFLFTQWFFPGIFHPQLQSKRWSYCFNPAN